MSPIDVKDAGYRHEAVFYRGTDDLVAQLLPFVRDGVAAREPTLVVLSVAKIDRLRIALGADCAGVGYADMAAVGANPARIIPLWQEFLHDHADGGRRVRGIGEPIWAGRNSAELDECHRHEELLNVAFDEPPFSLLCPYDTETLEPDVINRARHTHPLVRDRGETTASAGFPGAAAVSAPFREPLPPRPADAPVLEFRLDGLGRARAWVTAQAAARGLPAWRTGDLVLAFNELATNSVVHGGGRGSVSVWREDDAVICEIRDGGGVTDPLADRTRPAADARGGRGLWIANQLCELVQLRAVASGAVNRLHLRVPRGLA